MFTQEQINELLNNKNVTHCTAKTITYSSGFRLLAIKKYYKEGYSPKMIFEEGGFDLSVVGKKRAKDSLRRWRRMYDQRGEKGLVEAAQGKGSDRKKKTNFKNKDEEIEYLKTKIAYMDAENDFLAKLRGIKRE